MNLDGGNSNIVPSFKHYDGRILLYVSIQFCCCRGCFFQVTVASNKKINESVKTENDIPNSVTIGLFGSLKKDL